MICVDTQAGVRDRWASAAKLTALSSIVATSGSLTFPLNNKCDHMPTRIRSRQLENRDREGKGNRNRNATDMGSRWPEAKDSGVRDHYMHDSCMYRVICDKYNPGMPGEFLAERSAKPP
jgi:hypothetical protein